MFDFVKARKRVIQIILALIIIPFAFFGLDSYTRSLRDSNALAKVDGNPITQREFTEELGRQQERYRSILGRDADLSALDTPESRIALLDSMIGQRLVGVAALRGNLLVSDEVLRGVIARNPAFQSDGRFSMSNYESLLRARGMTAAGYEAQLRYDLGTGVLVKAISETAIPGRTVAERMAALEEEAREASIATVPAEAFLTQVKIDASQLKSYYEEHKADFRAPERVRAEYIALSAADLGKGEPPTEAEIKAAYDARAAKFQSQEQRRASHILITLAPDAKESDRKAARAKIDRIMAQLKKSPGRFAELAKEFSQDPGSAQKGGDLGFFGRGMMVKPFEDAAFAMKKEGDISGVVETEFGYHIIRLTGIQRSSAQPLQAMRAELVKEIERQKGLRKFTEAAEAFSNTVYEQPDSLKPAADQFKLQVRTTGWITKAGAVELGELNNKKLLNALFSADAIAAKRNTDAIEVASNTLVAARVVEHQPDRQRSFEEVRNEVERVLRGREAAKLAQKEGEAKLAALAKGGGTGLKWSASRPVSRRDPQGFPPDMLRRILAADASKLPTYLGVDRGSAGYVLIRIGKVLRPGVKTEAQRASDLTRAERQAGLAQYEAYVTSLRAQAEVNVDKDKLFSKP
jgi:peptidyl-prolyl cis-trans isomerase D